MRYVVKINGKEYDVEVEKLGGPYQSLTRGTAYMQTPVAYAPSQLASTPSPAPAPVASTPTPAPSPSPAPVRSGSGADITSPMPGKVFKLVAKEGDIVSEGQVILILEAMKMENEIVATSSGAVSFVKKEGDMVETDDVLAIIK